MIREGEKIEEWQKNTTNYKGGHLVYHIDPAMNSNETIYNYNYT